MPRMRSAKLKLKESLTGPHWRDHLDAISQGDVVSVDADTGVIVDETTGQTYQAQPFPPFIREIIEAGGLINRTKAKLGEE